MGFFLSTSLLVSGLIAGAVVAVPASRRLVMGADPTGWLGDELTFDHIADDRASVVLKEGGFFRVWQLRGTPYESKPDAAQANHAVIRADLFRMILTSGQNLRLFGIKRKKDLSYEVHWPSVTLEEIGAAEQACSKAAFDLSWFIVQQARSLGELEKTKSEIIANLGEYAPELLTTPDNSAHPCRLTAFLNYLVCGQWRDYLPAVAQSISANIPAGDFHFDRQGNITTFLPHRRHHRCLAVRGFPESISGQVIENILAVAGEIEIAQICTAQQREKTLRMLWIKKRQLESPLGRNEEKAGEHAWAHTEISADKRCYADTQFHIFVRAETEAALTALVGQLADILSRARILWSVEATAAAVACWFNRLPGYDKLCRPLKIHDHNIAVLWPFPYSPTGLRASAICPYPVRTFSTPSGVPYDFQFQCSDGPQVLGNFLMFGQAGSGKTTFVAHLLSGLSKNPDFRPFLFDSHEGMKFMIEAFGGQYRSFDSLSFNPLDVDDRSPKTRQDLHKLMRNMVALPMTDSLHDDISAFLDIALDIPDPDNRSFEQVFRCGARAGSPLRSALEKWVTNEKGKVGSYAHIFNARRDDLRGFLNQSFMTGINMNEALSDDVLGPSVVFHITNAISALARDAGKPFGIFIDEAANLLKNEAFRVDFATVMYREIRKMDGFIGLAFQDPSALSAFPKESEAILSNTSTFIFFPNATYSEEGLEPFKFSKEQQDFVMNRHPIPGARRVLILKRDAAAQREESAIVNVDLSPLGKALRFYRSGPEANRYLEKIKKEEGDGWLSAL